LDTVRDPELDESVLSLDFVSSCEVSEAGAGSGAVEVHLRLPTYFCAPNFAFLMVADAYDAVMAVDGVTEASILLDDHFASQDHQRGGGPRGPASSRRSTARRRTSWPSCGPTSCTRRCWPARIGWPARSGRRWTPERVCAAGLGDVPPSPDLDRLRHRRGLLGLPPATTPRC